MAGKSGVFRVNVVQNGVHPALVFDEPEEGKVFTRALKIDNENGSASWLSNDQGELPQREAEDGDYSDESEFGVTWHQNR